LSGLVHLSPVPAAAAEDGISILAMGDSLTHGYGLPGRASFPRQLEAALQAQGLDVTVINGGVSGDTTAGGLSRLEWSLGYDADAIIIELGGNDALRGIAPSVVEQNLDAMLARLGEEDIPVLLTGMKAPRNMGPDYAAEFDAVFPRLAEKHGVIFYPFFLEGVALDPDLMQDDGTHANEAGVAEIVRRIAPHVLELIERVDAPS
jgi:acyl-CoA thioesterase-1